MKLYVIDQISITAVKSDTMKPGESFVVSDAYGEELLERRPDAVSRRPAGRRKAAGRPASMPAPAPGNKPAAVPDNKGA